VVDAPAPRHAGRYGPAYDDGWGPATSVRGSSAQPLDTQVGYPLPTDSGYQPRQATRSRVDVPTQPGARERGLPAWAALAVLVALAGIGGIIDAVSGTQVRGGFNIGIIVASVIGILIVRRSSMFPIVVAPPIVYAGASGAMLYVRSNGLHDKSELFDAATNWLVYGFPAIAAATAIVLIIAGVRMITHR
jgi:hypothetical protein